MTAELSPVDYVLRASGMHIFERRTPYEPYGYKLVMPGVSIGADEVDVSYVDGVYTATETDGDGHTWTGTGRYVRAAILALIADRMGFTATIEIKPELEDDET